MVPPPSVARPSPVAEGSRRASVGEAEVVGGGGSGRETPTGTRGGKATNPTTAIAAAGIGNPPAKRSKTSSRAVPKGGRAARRAPPAASRVNASINANNEDTETYRAAHLKVLQGIAAGQVALTRQLI